MTSEMTFLGVVGAALATAVVHTLAGPDHYIPFIALSKSRGWNLGKTLAITLACGVGHVASALLLALVFAFFSHRLAESGHEWLNEIRGSLAAWMLTVFGLAYALYGIRHLVLKHRHRHLHVHSDGSVHLHDHHHENTHAHLHEGMGRGPLLTWSLFVIFVLGPCEALLPILAAASTVNSLCVLTSTLLFSVATVLTMSFAVTVGSFGIRRVTSPALERWSHVLAGLTVAFCGIGMIFFGL